MELSMDNIFESNNRESKHTKAKHITYSTLSSDKYTIWHRIYMNGTNKKIGNEMLDRIAHIYNEAGCIISYVYKTPNADKASAYVGFSTDNECRYSKNLSDIKEKTISMRYQSEFHKALSRLKGYK